MVGNVIEQLDTLKKEVQTVNNKLKLLDQGQMVLELHCDTLSKPMPTLPRKSGHYIHS